MAIEYGPATRRNFLTAAVVLASSRFLNAQSKSATSGHLLYIATYSSPQGPEGSKGNGEGIYLFEMDPANGHLTKRAVFPNADNPSWLAFDPSRAHLYSANETAAYNGTPSGSVSAYRIDRSSGRLTLLNTESSGGAGPCYLSIHPSGKYAFTANYAGGTVAVLPIRENGEVAQPTDVKRDSGENGSTHAASGPPGS